MVGWCWVLWRGLVLVVLILMMVMVVMVLVMVVEMVGGDLTSRLRLVSSSFSDSVITLTEH